MAVGPGANLYRDFRDSRAARGAPSRAGTGPCGCWACGIRYNGPYAWRVRTTARCSCTGGAAVQNPFLIGPTVYLRPLKQGDAPTLVTWFDNPEVTRYLLQYRPLTLAAEEEFLRRGRRHDGPRPRHCHRPGRAARRRDGAPGQGGPPQPARLVRHHARRDRHLGQGLLDRGHAAHGRPRLPDVEPEPRLAARLRIQRRGLRVYEKVGFRIEGRLAQDTFRDGRYWDTLVMGIPRRVEGGWGAEPPVSPAGATPQVGCRPCGA